MSEQAKIRILIVDDHFVAREGLKSLIGGQPDMQVAGEARDGADVIAAYRAARPDVVLMDMRMPGLDGLRATAMLLQEDARACVLVVSSYDTVEEVGRAHDAGARGYVLKEAEGPELLRAIRAVHRGERYLPPAVAARLEARRDEERLNVRETQILQCVQKGLTNAEIAAQLELTPGTIRIYMSSLLAKLGARNRTEAVTVATAKGLLKQDR
jgi:two-component system NarL family response regulator